MPLFLDPCKPIATCTAESCSGCSAGDTIRCHFDLQWFLLLLYVITSAAAVLTLESSFCSHCMNLACPFNSVPYDVREEFFKLNPQVAKAWGKGTNI